MNIGFNIKCFRNLGILAFRNLMLAFGPCWTSIIVSPSGKYRVRLYHPKYIMYFDSVVFSNLGACYACLEKL